MCRRIIEYWHPCNHPRLTHIMTCETARGTPGRMYEDCVDGENSYIEGPSSTPCPICQRSETFRDHIQQGGFTTHPSRRSADQTSSSRPQPTRSVTVSSVVCGVGEHQWRDIDNGGLSCVKCGTIGGQPSSTRGAEQVSDVHTPLL